MSYTTIAIIYNPNSTGSSQDMAKHFAKELKKKLPKQPTELIATKYAGHAEKLAYDIAKKEKHALIISSSGDGGYNEVVNGALKAQKEGYKVTTGLLPAGNANDHYRNIHETDTIDLIVKNKAKKVDVLKLKGTVNGKAVERYAHSYIGFGLTPKVGNELNKKKLNFLMELWLVAHGLFTVTPVKLKIGKKVGRYESVVFSNVDTMSKYLKISTPSSITDGKFEVTIFTRRSKLQLISTLLRASVEPIEEDAQVQKFSLETVKKTLVQLDGEIISLDARTKITVTAEKQLLRCVI